MNQRTEPTKLWYFLLSNDEYARMFRSAELRLHRHRTLHLFSRGYSHQHGGRFQGGSEAGLTEIYLMLQPSPFHNWTRVNNKVKKHFWRVNNNQANKNKALMSLQQNYLFILQLSSTRADPNPDVAAPEKLFDILQLPPNNEPA